MKLQADHRMLHVLDLNELAVVGGGRDGQRRRQPGTGDRQRVVPGRLERVRQPGKDAATIVLDAGCLAVHRAAGAHDPRAIGRPDALVAETHAEDRGGGTEPPDDVGGDPRFAGRAWPRRDDDVRGSELLDLLERRGVVPSYDGLLPQLLHVTRQVVHEGVVVVDEQDHGSRAAIRPRALSSVSRYSCAGSESATIPPPT